MFQNTIFFAPSDIKTIAAYAHRMNDERKSGVVGYYHLFDGEDALVSEVESFMSGKKHIKKVVLVGMGGSSCGVKALRDFLCFDKRGGAELFIIDNTDTSTFERLLAFANPENTLFIIASKTGTTIEVLTLFKLIIKHLNIDLTALCEHFAFITDEGSKLHALAADTGVKCFFIPQNVGGRFSVLSAIGVVPALLCGYDARGLLAGARACHEDFFGGKNDMILQKAYHFCTHKSAHSNVLFSYGDAFKGFGEWYVQLIAESLGKKQGFKRVGITPIALVGARDQHSFLQLIMEGPKDKTITFLKVLESNEENLGENCVNFGRNLGENSQKFGEILGKNSSDFGENFSKKFGSDFGGNFEKNSQKPSEILDKNLNKNSQIFGANSSENLGKKSRKNSSENPQKIHAKSVNLNENSRCLHGNSVNLNENSRNFGENVGKNLNENSSDFGENFSEKFGSNFETNSQISNEILNKNLDKKLQNSSENPQKIHANLNENSQNLSPKNPQISHPQNTPKIHENNFLKNHPNAHTFSSQEHFSGAHFHSPIVPNFSLPHLESCDFAGGVSLQSLLNAQCDATLQSLLAENLSIDLITLGAADAWHLGYLMSYCELLTSACGIMLGINTYDQPGVELGKLILKKMLTK